MGSDSTASAVTSIRSVLHDPARCEIDALAATRVAGMATTDTDATAYGHVSILHAMACAAGGALPPSEARPPRCLPYSSLIAMCLPSVLRTVHRRGSTEETDAMNALAESLLGGGSGPNLDGGYERTADGLARFLDMRFADLSVPTVRGLLLDESSGDSDASEAVEHLVALAVFNSPLVR